MKDVIDFRAAGVFAWAPDRPIVLAPYARLQINLRILPEDIVWSCFDCPFRTKGQDAMLAHQETPHAGWRGLRRRLVIFGASWTGYWIVLVLAGLADLGFDIPFHFPWGVVAFAAIFIPFWLWRQRQPRWPRLLRRNLIHGNP